MTSTNPVTPSTDTALDERIRDALEPDPAAVARLERRLEARLRGVKRPSRRARWPRLAAAAGFVSAVSLVLALAVFTAGPRSVTVDTASVDTALVDTASVDTASVDTASIAEEDPLVVPSTAPIVISNANGYVSVTTAASQWIVLPGDPP
ncbi:MAG: hypothetical protein AAGC60_09920 [Acidobacteriota bacterium]